MKVLNYVVSYNKMTYLQTFLTDIQSNISKLPTNETKNENKQTNKTNKTNKTKTTVMVNKSKNDRTIIRD